MQKVMEMWSTSALLKNVKDRPTRPTRKKAVPGYTSGKKDGEKKCPRSSAHYGFCSRTNPTPGKAIKS